MNGGRLLPQTTDHVGIIPNVQKMHVWGSSTYDIALLGAISSSFFEDMKVSKADLNSTQVRSFHRHSSTVLQASSFLSYPPFVFKNEGEPLSLHAKYSQWQREKKWRFQARTQVAQNSHKFEDFLWLLKKKFPRQLIFPRAPCLKYCFSIVIITLIKQTVPQQVTCRTLLELFFNRITRFSVLAITTILQTWSVMFVKPTNCAQNPQFVDKDRR